MFNTISCSIFTILIIYMLMYVEKNSIEKFSNNEENNGVSLKVPLASGILVWGFSNLIMNKSIVDTDLEIDLSNFNQKNI